MQSPVFLVNSRLGRFAAAPAGSPREAVHLQGHPFSRSYGVGMPSSLTMVLPIASVCSTRPPVSVLVRAPAGLPRGFSREHGIGGFTQSLRRRASPSCAAGICLGCGPHAFTGTSRTPPAYPSPSPHRSSSVPQAVQECPPAVHRLRLPASP